MLLSECKQKNILNEGLHDESKESALNKVYQSIKSTLKNTETPYNPLKIYKYQYQWLTEFQADYILDNVRWWKETDYGIEFLVLALLLKQQCNCHTFDQLQSKDS